MKKLTPADRELIANLYLGPEPWAPPPQRMSMPELAEKFEVCERTISRAIRSEIKRRQP